MTQKGLGLKEDILALLKLQAPTIKDPNIFADMLLDLIAETFSGLLLRRGHLTIPKFGRFEVSQQKRIATKFKGKKTVRFYPAKNLKKEIEEATNGNREIRCQDKK